MAAAKVTLVKVMTYRGDPNEEWSNSYHLDAAPADRAGWVTLVEALAALERHVYNAGSVITRAAVYDDGDNPATYVLSAVAEGFALAGDYPVTGVSFFAGDQADTIGWDTGLRGSSGKPIWLRKYFHGGVERSDLPDSLPNDFIAVLQTFGNALKDTAIDAGIHFADKNGRRPDGPARVDPYSTTRTLKRRGRRPTS